MKKSLSVIREFILDILFPKFCLNCNREGEYLCEDCFYLIDILDRQYCPFCFPPKVVIDGKTCQHCRRTKYLTGLFCVASYDNFIVKNLLNQFKYPPYIRELSKPLASLILAHFLKLEPAEELWEVRPPTAVGGRTSHSLINNEETIIIPVPLHKKKLKERGFNQAEEIGKELSKNLEIPIYNNILIKTKQTPAQVELDKEKRKKNIIGAFYCQNPEIIRNKKILLIDDVFTTGTTMEECARILKQSGAKQVRGAVIARG